MLLSKQTALLPDLIQVFFPLQQAKTTAKEQKEIYRAISLLRSHIEYDNYGKLWIYLAKSRKVACLCEGKYDLWSQLHLRQKII